jgi:competence protein ComFC
MPERLKVEKASSMTIELNGNWDKGLAFDVHSLSSTYLGPNEFGHDQWDTTRTEMGALVHN